MPSAAFPRHLSIGNAGRDVAIVKRALALEVSKSTGMNVRVPLVGPGTIDALRDFQQRHQLREDGYGLATHRALEHHFTRTDRAVLAGLAKRYPAFPARHKRRVFATQYGGPRDPGTPGHHGYRGDDLDAHPDSYAELSTNPVNGAHNDYAAIAKAIGDRYPLPYLTPIRVTYHGHQAVLYKRDVGFGGPGPNRKRDGSGGNDDPAIDLWWRIADQLGHNGWDWIQIEVGRH